MELIFLGTGAGMPAKERNVSSLALRFNEGKGETWLFDCGEATQHQILYTTIKPRKIEKIFISHLHGDHIFGLPGLLSSRSFLSGETPLTIFGPKGIKQYVETTLQVSQSYIQYPIVYVELKEGVLFCDEQMMVEARRLDHVIPSFGFRVVQKDRPGQLQVEKLREKGIAPGPIYQKIKQGENVQLEDGQWLQAKDYVGPSKRGKMIAILGDTRPCSNVVQLAEDADVMVHEATFSEQERDLAMQFGHSTAKQVAAIAKKARVKSLILTHISARFQKEGLTKLIEEAKEEFDHVRIASDLLQVWI